MLVLEISVLGAPIAPQANSASSFSQSMGMKGINLPDRFAINHRKKFTLPLNF
jgi:hypothetical protein